MWRCQGSKYVYIYSYIYTYIYIHIFIGKGKFPGDGFICTIRWPHTQSLVIFGLWKVLEQSCSPLIWTKLFRHGDAKFGEKGTAMQWACRVKQNWLQKPIEGTNLKNTPPLRLFTSVLIAIHIGLILFSLSTMCQALICDHFEWADRKSFCGNCFWQSIWASACTDLWQSCLLQLAR